jgi:hypothetical protein
MDKWADYLVSKEKWNLNVKRIDSLTVHIDKGNSVSKKSYDVSRNWVVQQIKNGNTFCCIIRNDEGIWCQGSNLTLSTNGGLNWDDNLPLILPKRKSFISYYHKDDKDYKEKFKNLTSDLIVNKSVNDGDIKSDNSANYVKQLINDGYLSDTTVLIVLLGPNTKCRKHVDWEISGALDLKVGDSYSGLLGLILPTHPDYGKEKYTYALHPQRLVDNLKTGYAVIRDFTTDRKKLQEYIELAFENRISKADLRTNLRIQKKINTCS